MTTEREFREWQAKRRNSSRKTASSRKNSRKSSKGKASGLLWFLGLMSLVTAVTLHKPNFHLRSQISLPTVQTIPSPPPQSLTVGAKTQLRDNFTAIDSQAQILNYTGNSIQELAKLLTTQAPTEAEKARIIYSWLAYHIIYDVPAYESGNYGDVSPESVLRNRTTVCSGYANLYAALAQAMGLEAEVIVGYGKGTSYLVGTDNKVNHAWNAVKINGNWYLMDATWGAGTVGEGRFQPRFNPHYFATPPEQFIYDHYPEQSGWQLLANTYSKTQFDELPRVFPAFFQNQINLVSHRQLHIQANQQVQIQLNAPPTMIATAQLRTSDAGANASQDQELPGNYTFVQQRNGQITINTSFPAPGNYELRIFAKNRQQEGLYPSDSVVR